MSSFVVVIPSRYASTRLPGKPLREINSKPMLEHVFDRGTESGASEVVIATDDKRIAAVAEGFGARVCMTSDQHRSGTERIAEVCDLMGWDDDAIVVNLQGDEPTMPAALIDQCAALHAREKEQQADAQHAALQHHGIYAYRCGVLRRLVAAEPSQLEVCEQLEQLRALSLGMTIRVAVPSERPGAGVDTEQDLEAAAATLAKQAQ